ncbi:MAG: hypothetical protein LBT98_03440 [Puniceicoccales bacterium]|jgi:hypothetical protein|nr:hypothetical protein [Puniceicoccales bacterium]
MNDHLLIWPERTLERNERNDVYREQTTFAEDVGRAMRDTAIYRIGKRFVVDPIHRIVERDDSDPDFDWRVFAERYSYRYPEEIFRSANGKRQALRHMADYDRWLRDRTAQSRHPVMNALLNFGGFLVDLTALHAIPFIGGLGHRIQNALGMKIAGKMGAAYADSILADVIPCATAFMMDTGAIELARTLASDRETLGDNAMAISANVALAGLLGGVHGAVGKYRAIRNRARTQKVAEKLDEKGLHFDRQPSEEEMEKFLRDIEAATSTKEESRRPLGPDDIPTLDDVVGKIPAEAGQSVVVQSFIRKIAFSSIVKASTSPCPITRRIAMHLADSRSLRVGPDANLRGVEIQIRSETNRLTNTVETALGKAWEKVRQDKRPEFSKINEQEFFDSIGTALWNGDTSANPYAAEVAKELRPTVDKMLELWKKADLGDRKSHFEEKFSTEAAKWENEVAELRKKMTEKPDPRVEKQLDERLKRLQKIRKTLSAEREELQKQLEANIKSLIIEEDQNFGRSVSLKIGKIDGELEKLRKQLAGEEGEHIDKFRKSHGEKLQKKIDRLMAEREELRGRLENSPSAAKRITVAMDRLLERYLIRQEELEQKIARREELQKTQPTPGNLTQLQRLRTSHADLEEKFGKLIQERQEKIEASDSHGILKSISIRERNIEKLAAYMARDEKLLVELKGKKFSTETAREIDQTMVRLRRIRAKLEADSRELNRIRAKEGAFTGLKGRIALREKHIILTDKALEDAEAALEKHRNWEPPERLAEMVERREAKRAEALRNLERVRRGELTDEEWDLPNGDPSYITRQYNIAEISRRPIDFINRISDWYEKNGGLNPKDAQELGIFVKNHILGNTYDRGPGLIHLPQVRGIEQRRILDIPTSEIADFIIKDPRTLFPKMFRTIVPDFHIKTRLGTLDTGEFEKKITSWYDGEIRDGRMQGEAAQKHLQTDVRALRALMARLRNISNLTGDAAWQNHNFNSGINTLRAVASAVMLGGVPSTALMDVATTMVSGTIGRTLVKVVPNFIKYFVNRKFSAEMLEDLRALGFYVENGLHGSSGRFTEAWQDPTLAAKIERGARKFSDLSYRLSGANAILGGYEHVKASVNCLDIRRLAEKAMRGKKFTLTEKNRLNLGRITEDELLEIGEQIGKFGEKDGGKLLNLDLWTNQRARENCIYTIHQWGDLDVMKPGFETPRLTPLGELLLQFKKFMIPAYDRCVLPTIQRLAVGEYNVVCRIVAMICLGGFRDMLNRVSEFRALPTAKEFILHGIAEADIFPFVGSMFKDMTQAFYSHDVLDTIGDNLLSQFIPPSVRVIANAIRGGNGLTKLLIGNERPTSKEVRALKQSIWMNNHYFLRGVLRHWQEAMLEPRKRK